MTERHIPVTKDELHAYVDNELSADRRQAVQAWLDSHPDDAERVREWDAFGEKLLRCYGGVVDEPVPQRLDLDRLAARPRGWVWKAAAAVLLAFIVGSGAGWMGRSGCATGMNSAEALRDSAVTAIPIGHVHDWRHQMA